jgi:hypothetical protein
LTLTNKIPIISRPNNDIIVELYTPIVPPFMVMFVKRVKKEALNENFKESIKVEKYLLSVEGKNNIDDEKRTSLGKNLGTQTKKLSNKKDQDFPYTESMDMIIKKVSNDVVYLKKVDSENTTRNFPKLPLKQYNNPPTSKTLTPTKEAHLGHLINFIKPNHNS